MTNIHDHDDDHDDAGNLFREEEHSDRRPTFPEFLNFIVGQLSPDPWWWWRWWWWQWWWWWLQWRWRSLFWWWWWWFWVQADGLGDHRDGNDYDDDYDEDHCYDEDDDFEFRLMALVMIKMMTMMMIIINIMMKMMILSPGWWQLDLGRWTTIGSLSTSTAMFATRGGNEDGHCHCGSQDGDRIKKKIIIIGDNQWILIISWQRYFKVRPGSQDGNLLQRFSLHHQKTRARF